jgi:hypothetical protein
LGDANSDWHLSSYGGSESAAPAPAPVLNCDFRISSCWVYRFKAFFGTASFKHQVTKYACPGC